MLALARARDRDLDQPLDSWLARHGQSPESVAGFWEVILKSALSESLDRISVSHARHLIVTAFLAHPRGWELVVSGICLKAPQGRRKAQHFQVFGGWELAASGIGPKAP